MGKIESKPYIPVEVLQGLGKKVKRARTPEAKLVHSQTYEVVEIIFNSQIQRQTPRS